MRTIVTSDVFNKVLCVIYYDEESNTLSYIEGGYISVDYNTIDNNHYLDIKLNDSMISEISIVHNDIDIVNYSKYVYSELFCFEPIFIEMDNGYILLDKSRFIINKNDLGL